jgi:hypothetical protein
MFIRVYTRVFTALLFERMLVRRDKPALLPRLLRGFAVAAESRFLNGLGWCQGGESNPQRAESRWILSPTHSLFKLHLF